MIYIFDQFLFFIKDRSKINDRQALYAQRMLKKQKLFSFQEVSKERNCFLDCYNNNKSASDQNQMEMNDITEKIWQKIKSNNKGVDLFNKVFLQPIEVAFKTWKTQKLDPQKVSQYLKDLKRKYQVLNEFEDKNINLTDTLPFGLKQVIKQNISNITYDLEDFKSMQQLTGSINYQTLLANNCDNMISLLKPLSETPKIKVCICICMYSEDKSALRTTLSGVADSIKHFIDNKTSADEIVVAIVQDGIQKVDSSVIEFFEELQMESGLFLNNQVPEVTLEELSGDDASEQSIKNFNNYLFRGQELNERREKRFSARRDQYIDRKKQIQKIRSLALKKNLSISDLQENSFIKDYLIGQARKQTKNKKLSEQQILQTYEKMPKDICRKKIQQLLIRARNFCQKYIESRNDLALINCFKVDFSDYSFIGGKNKNIVNSSQQLMKMNLMFITKYQNSGKLSSHNWFFNGLCRQILPQFAVLLDVGLCPKKGAIFKMCDYLSKDPDCGGVCGYMGLRLEKLQGSDQQYLQKVNWTSKFFHNTLFDIQQMQQVQYHFAHLIDKPFQSMFDFIHVLPGAFSAYSMQALSKPTFKNLNPLIIEQKKKFLKSINQMSKQQFEKQDKKFQMLEVLRFDSQLLKSYFKSMEQSTEKKLEPFKSGIFKTIFKVILPDFLFYCGANPRPGEDTQEGLLYHKNVTFAEDRTLCLGIFNNDKKLHYLPDAHAQVDPVKTLHDLMGQRKRWINGSYFAFEGVKEYLLYKKSGHVFLKFQVLFLALMNILSFVSPAFFMFTVHLTMLSFKDWFFGIVVQSNFIKSSFETTQFFNSFVYVIDLIYILLILGLIFKSMFFKNRDQRFYSYVYILSTILGLFSFAFFILMMIDLIKGIQKIVGCLIDNSQNQYCAATFLVDSPILQQLFFQRLPGGMTIYLIFRAMVIAVLLLYFVPLLNYWIFFCRFKYLLDILLGVFSFIFYTPTYLIILPTFALCRIDDISWGTKGLDSGANTKNQNLSQTWKVIKIIQVAKYVFWNIIVGAALLILSTHLYNMKDLEIITQNKTQEEINNLLIRKQQMIKQVTVQTYIRMFFINFVLMSMVFILLSTKVVLGALYSMIYRCKQCCTKNNNNQDSILRDKSFQMFYSIEQSLKKDVKSIIKQYCQSHKADVEKFITYQPYQPELLLERMIELMTQPAMNGSQPQSSNSNKKNGGRKLEPISKSIIEMMGGLQKSKDTEQMVRKNYYQEQASSIHQLIPRFESQTKRNFY